MSRMRRPGWSIWPWRWRSAEREEALYRQAHFDELTGLPNRQLLKDRLEQQIVQTRRDDQNGALLYIDLDRFKEINDVSTATRLATSCWRRLLNESCRGRFARADTVSRLGGDEFVIVMPQRQGESQIEHNGDEATRRRSVGVVSVRGDDHFLGARVSALSLFPDDGDSVETLLLKNADAAMYRAKEAGRSGSSSSARNSTLRVAARSKS